MSVEDNGFLLLETAGRPSRLSSRQLTE